MKGIGKTISKNHCHHVFVLLWSDTGCTTTRRMLPGRDRQELCEPGPAWRSQTGNCRWSALSSPAGSRQQPSQGLSLRANWEPGTSHRTSVNGCFGENSKQHMLREMTLSSPRMQRELTVNLPPLKAAYKANCPILLSFLSQVLNPSTSSLYDPGEMQKPQAAVTTDKRPLGTVRLRQRSSTP